MERISMLLQKITAIMERGNQNGTIDIDLALDYTRVLYADLTEIRNKMTTAILPVQEPTLAELTEAMNKEIPQKDQPIIKQEVHATPTEHVNRSQQTISAKNDIRNFIGINDKYLFISELFGNDKDSYEQLLDEINSVWNEENARQLLKEYANIYEEEDNETLLLFYGLLSKFFSTI